MLSRYVALIGLLLAAAPAVAQSQPQSQSQPYTLIHNARVFDGQSVIAATDVLIRGDRIEAIGRGLAAPQDAETISAEGHTLLPGLIDAHTHVFGEALREALIFGVTTELDMFTDIAAARRLKAEQATDGAPGRADIFTAGTLVTAPGGHGTQFGMTIPTLTRADSAQAFVDARIAEGSDWIKIVHDDGHHFGIDWPTLSRDVMVATIEAAHRRDRLALVHVSTAAQAHDAIDAGADGLVHLFTDRPATDELIALARSRGVFLIPTMTVLKSMTGEPGAGTLLDDPRFTNYLTPVQRASLREAFPTSPERVRGYGYAVDAVRRMAAAGVTIVAGTDAPNPGTTHGAAMHRELELLVEAGLSPAEALEAGTATPARLFGLDDRGRIAPGLRADLLLVRGDPTTNILATREIAGIWKAGVRFDRTAAATAAVATAQAPTGTDGPALIADFEDGTLNAAFGTQWLVTTDSMAGGGSWARIEVTTGGAGGSTRALSITGEASDRVAYAWAGAMWSPGAVPMQPVDLSAADGVSFDVRGDGATYRLLIFAQSRGMMPLTKTFTAPVEWAHVSVPWSAFGVDGSDIMAVMFVGGPQPGAFSLSVDNVRLH